eukprot:3994901-Amphidinium_carterae.1
MAINLLYVSWQFPHNLCTNFGSSLSFWTVPPSCHLRKHRLDFWPPMQLGTSILLHSILYGSASCKVAFKKDA